LSTTKKRIVLGIPSLTRGGAELQAFELAKYLKNSPEFTPVIVCFGRVGKLAESCDLHQIEWHDCPLKHTDVMSRGLLSKAKFVFSFSRWLRKLNPDVLMGYEWFSNLVLGISWKLVGAKAFVWGQHGIYISQVPLNKIERLIRMTKPCYVAPSRVALESVKAAHGFNEYEGEYIYNVIPSKQNCALNTTKYREKLSIKEQDIIVVLVANFFEGKGHLDAINAINEVPEINGKKVHLLLAGFGPGLGVELLKSKALAFDLQLQDRVHFLGSILDIQPLLAESDVGLIASHSESFGVALVEYMRADLPVVLSDLEATREILGDDYPFRFKVKDYKAMAHQIAEAHNSDFKFSTFYKQRNDVLKMGYDSTMNKYTKLIEKHFDIN
jgi:glycosyltransferase involved in cell wall biosynthesis